jgi:YVTN family beta-propeller protein
MVCKQFRSTLASALFTFVVLFVLSSTFVVGKSAQNKNKALSKCDAPPSEPISYVTLPGHPFKVVSSDDGCWLFASLEDEKSVANNGLALLRKTGNQITVKKIIPLKGEPAGLVMTHDQKLLVTTSGDNVYFLDVERMISDKGDPILGSIATGNEQGSVYVTVTSNDEYLFVSEEQARSITVINLRKARTEGFSPDAIVGKIPVGNDPIALTFSPDERWLYTTSQVGLKKFGWPAECTYAGMGNQKFPSGAITVIDVAKAKTEPANSVVANVQAGCSPVRLAISPDGKYAYVTARGSNSVLAFDTAKLIDKPTEALIGTVPVGLAPVGVIVVNNGKQVIVTNSNRFASDGSDRQTLTVIDSSKVTSGQSAITRSIPAGSFPREFCLSPNKRTLYVTNFNSKELEIINLDKY